MIYDNHGRLINYLRLAVTDRCNLRCFYCMPKDGLDWLPRKELMSYEEMLRICKLLANLGIEKVRITGGEPFVRKDLISFLQSLVRIKGIKEVSITTNGILTANYIPQLKELGISSINLSLDSLDRNRFFHITRRNELPTVLNTFYELLAHGMKVKLNTVVMEGRNTEDIVPLVHLTKDLPISVRFIEEMPFNGEGHSYSGIQWNYLKILEVIREQFPELKKKTDPPFSTSFNYEIPGHKGTVGIIAAYTRSFCGSCNRIRITPQGNLKTCLYDNGMLNIKQLMRDGFKDDYIEELLLNELNKRSSDGWEVQKKFHKNVQPSMATIGG
jgi:molybdenum cofactor biosynthesis protein A